MPEGSGGGKAPSKSVSWGRLLGESGTHKGECDLNREPRGEMQPEGPSGTLVKFMFHVCQRTNASLVCCHIRHEKGKFSDLDYRLEKLRFVSRTQ